MGFSMSIYTGKTKNHVYIYMRLSYIVLFTNKILKNSIIS